MQPESNVEGRGSDGKEDENQMLEDEEWNGIGNDDENDNGTEDWKTDDEEADDSFEEGIVDVSDSEILHDKDGNIIEEEDIGEGLKEIMTYHMSKLHEKLDMFATLASTEVKDDDDEDDDEKTRWMK